MRGAGLCRHHVTRDGRIDVGASLTSNHHLADYCSERATAKCRHDMDFPENIMKVWAPRLAIAALVFGGATLGFAQTAPGPTHDCSGMTGTALVTCQQLNRNVNEPAPSGAGTPNDCSGMTGAPLASCRRLNAAETLAPSSSAGASEDCSGQVGDALRACRALNGQSTEYDVPTGGAVTSGSTRQ
jgi:hypothetical protein